MTDHDSPKQNPSEGATESGNWQVRVLLTILAAFAGAFVAIAFPAFEPTTTQDATIVSAKSSTTWRDSGRRQTNWTIVLRLDDGRTVSSSAAPLGRGVDSGDRVEIELTDFSETVSSATWPGGEFAKSRAVAGLFIVPVAALALFLLAFMLKQRWSHDRHNALTDAALSVAGFSIAAAWPFLT